LHYVRDRFDLSYVFIPPTDGIDWFRPEKLGETYRTQMPVLFLVENMRADQLIQFYDPDYHPERSEKIRSLLDEGLDPLAFAPISVSFEFKDKIINIGDGIHRLQVFNEKGYKWINSELNIYYTITEIHPPKQVMHEVYAFRNSLLTE
jgi:hypothetical protein